jgi:putative endonuclease
MFWVYILQNPNGRFYIGHTDNLRNRVASHNRTDKTSGKFTRKNGPWILIWSEEHPDRASAVRREMRNQIMEICAPDSKSVAWIGIRAQW